MVIRGILRLYLGSDVLVLQDGAAWALRGAAGALRRTVTFATAVVNRAACGLMSTNESELSDHRSVARGLRGAYRAYAH